MSDRKPYFFLYADDFLSGVLGMPDADVGVYMKLLCLAWSKDGVTDLEAESTTRDDDAIKRVLSSKFERGSDGKWRNQKLEKVRAFADKQSQNGAKRKAKPEAKTEPDDKPNPEPQIQNQNHIQNHKPEPNPTDPQTPKGVSLDEFLKRWNNFVADRPKLKPVRKATGKRQDKIRSRLKDPGWFADFREAIMSLPLPGDGWQPDLDWLIKNDHNIYLLLEGAFDWRGKDDPAAQRLAQRRRHEAYERRQREETAKREKATQAVSGTRRAIENILPADDGESRDAADTSLLFGQDQPTASSSVSGAGSSRRRSSSQEARSE